MKNLVFFGIQGSGKGTQGAIIAEKYGLKVFETGGALRAIAASSTPLGKKVKSIIESGNLVPNEIVMAVIADFLENAGHENVLFDGIPRSKEQKKTFDALLKKAGRDFLGVLIDISEAEAKKRLLGRRLCEKCKKVFAGDFAASSCDECGGKLAKRSDDNEKAILQRLENFTKETLPAITAYEKEGLLVRINGEQPVEKVTADIEKVLTKRGGAA